MPLLSAGTKAVPHFTITVWAACTAAVVRSSSLSPPPRPGRTGTSHTHTVTIWRDKIKLSNYSHRNPVRHDNGIIKIITITSLDALEWGFIQVISFARPDLQRRTFLQNTQIYFYFGWISWFYLVTTLFMLGLGLKERILVWSSKHWKKAVFVATETDGNVSRCPHKITIFDFTETAGNIPSCP